jgi:hypothetical protein
VTNTYDSFTIIRNFIRELTVVPTCTDFHNIKNLEFTLCMLFLSSVRPRIKNNKFPQHDLKTDIRNKHDVVFKISFVIFKSNNY